VAQRFTAAIATSIERQPWPLMQDCDLGTLSAAD